jgi:hypothetical protein
MVAQLKHIGAAVISLTLGIFQKYAQNPFLKQTIFIEPAAVCQGTADTARGGSAALAHQSMA